MTAANSAEPWSGRNERFRLFLWIDVAVATGAALFMAIVHVTVSDTGWVAVLAVCVTMVAVALLAAQVLLARGRVIEAFAVFAAANWVIALVAATAAPFAMPVLVIISLLPAALAVPVVSRVQLPKVVAITIVVVTAVVALGTLQDVVQIEDDLPGWVPKLVTLMFTPVMAGLVAIIVYQTIETLTQALDEAVTSRDRLRDAQARIVTASDEARRGIERDLHDGAQQRLTALAIGLGRIHARAGREDLPIADDVGALRDHLADARSELRRLAHGLYPSALEIDGLEAALRGEADRFDLPITVRCEPLPGVSLAIQVAVYFCCLEALQNAVHHGDPASVLITVSAAGGDGVAPEVVIFEVVDDGSGFDASSGAGDGRGFANMADRVGAFGGTIVVESVPGDGTTVRGTVPAG
ncbi:MAG: sensor histidine kinase [Acidimicrobiales bacterium]